jgi:hypothetical protein
MIDDLPPLTGLIIHLIKSTPDELQRFSRKDARPWLDKGLSEDVVREYLTREREKRGL